MADRDAMIARLSELLEIDRFDEPSNGLQVPGTTRIEKVASGVTPGLTLIERAIESGADLLLTHHGLFWRGAPPRLSFAQARRLRAAFAADLNLACYHLPLDAHPDLGNNALLCRRLGFQPSGRFAAHGGATIGVIGSSEVPVAIESLCDRIADLLDREPLLQGAGPPLVSRIGFVSGAAHSSLLEAIELNLDAFLTGEPGESMMHAAEEAAIHAIAAGHYATETLGVRALGDWCATEFGIEHEFIALPNPV